LQLEFLKAFFAREDQFFLTGRAALAGFHLGHRETYDLDLFTLANAMDAGVRAATEAAQQMGASIEAIQTAPDFRRLLLRREDKAVEIDLVHEFVTQCVPDKPLISGIRVDPPEEILANKLCALLSRSEVRDLIDLRALEAAGFKVEAALPFAALKDTGLTPAQLSWVLNQIELGDQPNLPGNVSATELQQYLNDLIERLTRLTFPG
jgi:Nucleotidyl transferase AbiEii toxin, Type IV TA system